MAACHRTTSGAITMTHPSPQRTHAALGIALFFLIAVVGLFYVKWSPYYSRAFTAAETHSIGQSILSGSATTPPAPSLHAALDYARAYGLAIWKALVLGLLLGSALDVLEPRQWVVHLLRGAGGDRPAPVPRGARQHGGVLARQHHAQPGHAGVHGLRARLALGRAAAGDGTRDGGRARLAAEPDEPRADWRWRRQPRRRRRRRGPGAAGRRRRHRAGSAPGLAALAAVARRHVAAAAARVHHPRAAARRGARLAVPGDRSGRGQHAGLDSRPRRGRHAVRHSDGGRSPDRAGHAVARHGRRARGRAAGHAAADQPAFAGDGVQGVSPGRTGGADRGRDRPGRSGGRDRDRNGVLTPIHSCAGVAGMCATRSELKVAAANAKQADSASAIVGPRPGWPAVNEKMIDSSTAPSVWPVSRAVASMPLAPPERCIGALVTR